MTDAPIRHRMFHDAHLAVCLFVFFIAVALPFRWHTVVTWSVLFAVTALLSGVTWRFIFKSLLLAFVLSISIWLLNVFFHAADITAQQALQNANQTALKIWALTWVALLSSKIVNLRDVITSALQRRWLSTQIAYASLVGIGSIELMRTEIKRIGLNAKLRGIKGFRRFSQWIPLLVFALRHAQRGAMSLRARGISTHKVFYYDYQATRAQNLRFMLLMMVFIGTTGLSEHLL